MNSFWNNVLKFGLIFLLIVGIIGIVVAVINRTQGWASIVLTIGLVIVLSILMYFVASFLMKKLFGFDIQSMFSEIMPKKVESVKIDDTTVKNAVINSTVSNMKEYCNVLNLLEKQQNWEEYSKFLQKYPNRKCS